MDCSPSRTAPVWAFCGLQLLQGGPSAAAWGPPGPAEDNLLHHGLLHGLQGNLCSSPQSTSSPSFFSHLAAYRAVSHTFLPHSSLLGSILPFLTDVSQKCHHSRWLRGSAVPGCGWVGAIWDWLCLAWGSPGRSSEAPAVPAASAWAPAPYTPNFLSNSLSSQWKQRSFSQDGLQNWRVFFLT